ncbi:MAG TPA: ZIP family metal transporter [Patescibacteria group bacterium]|nr:ZIP family metal transporter [Patescibacteria group bacterium]
MTQIILYTIISVLIVNLIALTGIFVLSVKDSILDRVVFLLVSLSAGALLGDAIIHLIPESYEELATSNTTSILIILGILLFFVLEKFLHWHHSHTEDAHELHSKEHGTHEPHSRRDRCIDPKGYIILVSDGIHNLLDGVIIGVSFLASIELGIASTIAIVLHEIPQEIGDFGLLVHSGFRKGQALLLNFVSGMLAILGAVFALSLGSISQDIVMWLLPITAGGFIYIALSDIVPELHKVKKLRLSFFQLIALVVGIVAMLLLTLTEVEEQEELESPAQDGYVEVE